MRDAARVIAAVAAVALLVGCGGGAGSGASKRTGAGEPADGHAHEAATAPIVPGAREVRVVAEELKFTPETLELVAGEPVTVRIHNAGALLHDFTVEQAGVHVNVEPGAQASTGLQIDRPGVYRAICTVPGHAEAGMVVELTVTQG